MTASWIILQLKHLKLMGVRGNRPLPAMLGYLTATTSLSLCASAQRKEGQTCRKRSKLFATLQMLMLQLSQLQRIDLLLPTDVEVVWSLCSQSPNLAVACLQDSCKGLERHCESLQSTTAGISPGCAGGD